MKTRIQQIMNEEGMTQQAFASALAISPASLSSIFTGRTNPTQNHVQAIHRTFPKININWLMFGEGSMYGSNEGQQQGAVSDDGNGADAQQRSTAQNEDGDNTKTAASMARQPLEIRYLERPPRQITEIRIFFDDGTYETFARNEKK